MSQASGADPGASRRRAPDLARSRAGPFVGLVAFGVESADTPLGFSVARLGFASLPGTAALLATAVPAIYSSTASGGRRYGY